MEQNVTVRLRAYVSSDLQLQLDALAEACERSLEVRERVLGLLDARAQAGGVDGHPLVTVRTVDGGIALEPSDLLRQLVTA